VSEQLAIIRKPELGCRDTNAPVLSFEVYITEATAALQVLSWQDAHAVLSRVRDIRDLEGKPCWVKVDGNMIRFQRLWPA
jgi:hypothetical protein